MRWQGNRRSDNVDDRRRSSVGGGVAIGGIGTIGILLVMWLFGADPSTLLSVFQSTSGGGQTSEYVGTEEDDQRVEFVRVVLASTEDVWTEVFNEMGNTYVNPKLVVYHQTIQSACGLSSSASGPFYCPNDQCVYIDISFYDELQNKFKAGGDFAFAYVVAHEIGHHVQKLLGTLDKENALRQRMSEKEANALSVRTELQADFYAGFWAQHVKDNFDLTKEDISEALNAAAAVGDDRIQKEAQGYVVPDAFTHGSSEQRQRWFFKGYEANSIEEGDTFSNSEL